MSSRPSVNSLPSSLKLGQPSLKSIGKSVPKNTISILEEQEKIKIIEDGVDRTPKPLVSA